MNTSLEYTVCDDHDGPLFELLAATVGAPPGVKFVRSSPTSAAHAWMRSVGGAVVRGAPSVLALTTAEALHAI